MNNGTRNIPKTQRIYRRTASKAFRDILVKKYFRIEERKHYWPLLVYLLFPTQITSNGKILLARNTLSELFGYTSIPPYFNSERMLRGFSEAIQPFTWSDYNKFEKRAREVDELIWPKEIEDALALERERVLWREGRVYLISGEPFSKRKQYQFMKDERTLALQQPAKTKETKKLLDYMNNLPNNTIAYLIKRNSGRTLDVINNLEVDNKHQWNIFASILDNYNQLYQPADKTVRIFPYGERIVSLKSEVRRALTHGLIEGDLKSAQLAIAANLWNVTSIKEFLTKGGSIWEYLYQLGSTNKDALKDVLYSLMFGMHHTGTAAQLKEIGISYQNFAGLPLIKDLIHARNREMRRIREEGGATTCFGQRLSVNTTDPEPINEQVRSILAQCCQSMELKILLPIIELADKNSGKHGFTVLLWQHDGFTLHCHSSANIEHWKWLISEEVNSSAKANGIMTQLCWKEI